ncbi:efflux RND transporter permease subunit [Acaryochloris marina]|uniref:Acriflavin resistance protein, putative n=1 Tax=Acaryochloris marina (strain MBIC 11017) TaxID=329726 RepID=A8ZKD3_ACAM1|nr:efflux RND transporter permease subunit [Acaryochloris marina]ABW31633.1 acriflavin resistance protein, putative [Acaryochloris marina MBIC11017]
MWTHFYRNTRLLILTICIILVWGLSSFHVLPRMEDPAISQWTGKITTRFPSASATRVDSLVTEKLEQKLQEVEEIKFIESTSQLGTSLIFIVLKDTVKNHDEVWSSIRDRIADITPQLPSGVLAPKYEDMNDGRGYTLIVALTWELDTPPNYAILNRLSENLKQQLRGIGGIEEIEFWGAPSEEILVEINPVVLGKLGITPQQLAQQIRLSDAKVSSGRLLSPNNDLLLEVNSEIDSLERIRQIPIRTDKNSEQLIPLGDIALVKKSRRDPPSELAIINGKPGITLAVLVEPNRRVDQWMEEANQTLEAFRGTISSDIGLDIILNQNRYVETRLNSLFMNLMIGVVFVVASTTLLMGGKSALVLGLSLPLSILMVFGGMRLLEIPLHQMSLTGLVIALGMLIDNAIVVVDEIKHLFEEGLNPQKAIARAVSYLAIPLLASTLTTVLTFFPIAILRGHIGEYVRTISISVIVAISSSLLFSLTIIPAIMSRMYQKGEIHQRNMAWWRTGFSNPQITKVYRRILGSILTTPLLGVGLAIILPIIGFMAVGHIPEQFFPPAERNQFQIKLELPLSTSMEQTKSIVEKASNLIAQHSEVTDLHWFIGTYAPTFYYTVARHGIKGEVPHYATAMVQTNTGRSIPKLIHNLQRELDQGFPSARILVEQLKQALPIPPIELRVYGPDLDILEELGNQVRSELVQVPQVIHTRTSLGEFLPKLTLSLDEEQAQLTGLDNTQIAQQLNTNLEGTVGGSILEDTVELPLRVRLSSDNRANLDQITTIGLVPKPPLSPEKSTSIPLSALGQIDLIPETAIITRRNGQRVNTVQGFITAGVLPSTVLADFQQRLNNSNFQLPPGYSMEWGGEAAERNEAVGNLLSTAGIFIVLMVSVLVLSFNSFRSAGIILLVAVGSVGLALASLWLFGYPLGFMAILGTVGLVGVAINDSIVVLAAIRTNPRARKGFRPAMVDVIVRSTRHVLTTTITTVSGFIPLLLDGGELWPPLAICIAGGVGGATFLALFFVPCAYLIVFGQTYPKSFKLSGNPTS